MDRAVEIKTERLLLISFRLGDVDDVLAYAADEEWGRYLPVPRPYLRKDAEEFLAKKTLESWESRAEFAVVFEGTVVGGIGLGIVKEHALGLLGYGIARQLWGKGMTPEAARAVIGYGFQSRGLEKIAATADLRNERSWRVMEKLGMQREGLLRSQIILRGERMDEVTYGVLREEWEQQSC